VGIFDRKGLFLFIFSLMFFMSAQVVKADRIYQWKDSAGITHFTNNESNIPKQYRVKVKDMKLQAATVTDEGQLVASSTGKQLWHSYCASCHVPGVERKERLRPLASVILDPDTRFQRSPDALNSILRMAIEGRTTDMTRIEISDADLLEITHYLIEYSKNN